MAISTTGKICLAGAGASILAGGIVSVFQENAENILDNLTYGGLGALPFLLYGFWNATKITDNKNLARKAGNNPS